MGKKIDISKVNLQFGGKYAPEDKLLIKLFELAYKGDLLCYRALIKTEGIEPASDFKPEADSKFRAYFEKWEAKQNPPPLYVYQNGDKFIMSDDYNAYFLYLEKGYQAMPCVVLGNPTGPHVLVKGEPFKLPPLEAELVA